MSQSLKMKMCYDFSKSFRPDKIPSHVFEIDEDFEKDEVRSFFFFTYSALRSVKKQISQGKVRIQLPGVVFW